MSGSEPREPGGWVCDACHEPACGYLDLCPKHWNWVKAWADAMKAQSPAPGLLHRVAELEARLDALEKHRHVTCTNGGPFKSDIPILPNRRETVDRAELWRKCLHQDRLVPERLWNDLLERLYDTGKPGDVQLRDALLDCRNVDA